MIVHVVSVPTRVTYIFLLSCRKLFHIARAQDCNSPSLTLLGWRNQKKYLACTVPHNKEKVTDNLIFNLMETSNACWGQKNINHEWIISQNVPKMVKFGTIKSSREYNFAIWLQYIFSDQSENLCTIEETGSSWLHNWSRLFASHLSISYGQHWLFD